MTAAPDMEELRAELREKLAALNYSEEAFCRAQERYYGGACSSVNELSAERLEGWLGTVDWALRSRAMVLEQAEAAR